jgi:uracil-DNA glycosylase family 4
MGERSTQELDAFHEAHVLGCTRCPLSEERTQVVPGSGDADAEVMFVGEAPGYHEDRQGVPFVGQAGKLLDELLAEIDLTRDDVFVANVLKCRPPGNRDPRPDEIEACESHLFRQIEIISPALVCTLGNFSTKLLSGRPDGITRVHGHELPITLGTRRVLLYPLFHPAAALYTPAMKETLRADFARIPGLVASLREGRPAPPVVGADAPPPPAEPEPEPATAAVDESQEQLGLF